MPSLPDSLIDSTTAMVVRTDIDDVELYEGRFALRERWPYFWAEPAVCFKVLSLSIYYCV